MYILIPYIFVFVHLYSKVHAKVFLVCMSANHFEFCIYIQAFAVFKVMCAVFGGGLGQECTM